MENNIEQELIKEYAEKLVKHLFDSDAEEAMFPVIVSHEGMVLFGKVTVKLDYSSLLKCPACKSYNAQCADQNDLFTCPDCGNTWVEKNVNDVSGQDILDRKEPNFRIVHG